MDFADLYKEWPVVYMEPEDGFDEAVKKIREAIEEVESRKSTGRCPKCGELGKYINLQPVCSKHGSY